MSKWKWILIALETLLVVGLLAGFGLVRVSGESMSPTLSEGDILLYAKWGQPEIGEIVLLDVPALDRLLVKRISEESAGRYFVLGDNAEESEDSRNPAIGWIESAQIKGRVIYRMLPLTKRGPIGGID